MKCDTLVKSRIVVMVGIVVILSILSLSLCSATLGTYKQGGCVNIITALNTSSVNITSISSPTVIKETNKAMTKIGRSFNYSFCDTSETGTYVYGYCNVEGNCYENNFIITSQGLEKENTLLSTIFMFGIVIGLSLFLYMKVSRFFGSMMIFILGFGGLFTLAEYGWIGWVIISSGMIMVVYSIMTPKKMGRRFR